MTPIYQAIRGALIWWVTIALIPIEIVDDWLEDAIDRTIKD